MNFTYQTERARVTAIAPPDTQAYIKLLEDIAEAGYDLWIHLGQPKERKCADDLYDLLAQVNYLHEVD